MRYLNIGCGHRFHKDWINIDLHAADPSVIQWDIRRGLPFDSDEFDVVYHSHVLEHLTREDAALLLAECGRVLKSSGILRVAVPDLERIAKDYLRWLDRASDGDVCAESNYDWIMLELYDQIVRRTAGGEMLAYLHSGHVTNLGYVRERCGDEIAALAQPASGAATGATPLPPRLLARARATLRSFRERWGLSLLGIDRSTLEEAQFSARGEAHRWMYDRFSLKRLLRKHGFEDIRVISAIESKVPGWASFGLDADEKGRPRKPDSLYVEAGKP